MAGDVHSTRSSAPRPSTSRAATTRPLAGLVIAAHGGLPGVGDRSTSSCRWTPPIWATTTSRRPGSLRVEVLERRTPRALAVRVALPTCDTDPTSAGRADAEERPMSNPLVVVRRRPSLIDRAQRVLRRRRVRPARRQAAPAGGRRAGPAASARAALRSSAELTVLLAGSQLGITACTLALGAITKPAVHHWLTPAFEASGLPAVAADVAGVRAGPDRRDVPAPRRRRDGPEVVGDRPPGAVGDAAGAADARVHVRCSGRCCVALNAMANWCLRRVGVEPADEVAAGHRPRGRCGTWSSTPRTSGRSTPSYSDPVLRGAGPASGSRCAELLGPARRSPAVPADPPAWRRPRGHPPHRAPADPRHPDGERSPASCTSATPSPPEATPPGRSSGPPVPPRRRHHRARGADRDARDPQSPRRRRRRGPNPGRDHDRCSPEALSEGSGLTPRHEAGMTLMAHGGASLEA